MIGICNECNSKNVWLNVKGRCPDCITGKRNSEPMTLNPKEEAREIAKSAIYQAEGTVRLQAEIVKALEKRDQEIVALKQEVKRYKKLVKDGVGGFFEPIQNLMNQNEDLKRELEGLKHHIEVVQIDLIEKLEAKLGVAVVALKRIADPKDQSFSMMLIAESTLIKLGEKMNKPLCPECGKMECDCAEFDEGENNG